MINGHTEIIAHLGYPTHSFKAPMIYNPFFAEKGVNAIVVPMGCRAEEFAAFLPLVFRLSNIRGALITMHPPLRKQRKHTQATHTQRMQNLMLKSPARSITVMGTLTAVTTTT